ncbi:MAG: hypothetical protein IPM63_08210 [Acidobacteriota bacterium]|nr:MAG: hypothetical protein IPM63_08210 [Acidobacteriota bacterium]
MSDKLQLVARRQAGEWGVNGAGGDERVPSLRDSGSLFDLVPWVAPFGLTHG